MVGLLDLSKKCSQYGIVADTGAVSQKREMFGVLLRFLPGFFQDRL